MNMMMTMLIICFQCRLRDRYDVVFLLKNVHLYVVLLILLVVVMFFIDIRRYTATAATSSSFSYTSISVTEYDVAESLKNEPKRSTKRIGSNLSFLFIGFECK